MLTRNLLRYRIDDGRISPAFLAPDSPRYGLAVVGIWRIICSHLGKTRGELDSALEKFSAGRTDYRVIRGLASVLLNQAEFVSGAGDAPDLRNAVFQEAARNWPIARHRTLPRDAVRQGILETVAADIRRTPSEIEEDLYDDLPERQRLLRIAPPAIRKKQSSATIWNWRADCFMTLNESSSTSRTPTRTSCATSNSAA